MHCGSKCAQDHGHTGPHDFEVYARLNDFPASSTERTRWWECFFQAAGLLPSILDSPKDDRGARTCAEFADQAVEEARIRGML